MLDLTLASAFVVFDNQDSGCLSYGVAAAGRRWFVKKATTPQARLSLIRASRLHTAVEHPAIVRPERILDGPDGLTLVYPWLDGRVLNQATTHGSDRTALARFQQLPLPEVEAAIDTILDAHLAVTTAGYVAVDLYDGCFLYDFAARRMRLIDLDEYRPGPFVLHAERLPGSRRYMAPEELVRGAVIDQRSTVHTLGRAIQHLLDSADGWRGSPAQDQVATRATRAAPADRYPDVAGLVAAWRSALMP
ncbi:serine/threonine protein kinase [Micromonospora sp. 4G57]|uniref:Serine/threonine protein kinase n=1 Tax=Micromonospora sicca TaxID=2202420 RepID=A0ABU5JNQ9_9ACTN|nr:MULTISPECIES: serine/threonine protein kinase [unclassified Micromonospora]MDZ5447564.1 serine/threonine protein kinase [Micromonospora sp. 4G57]MDZ5494280.1 serine/threonine protein kinase [Micromonospora sp. 4G53]